MAIEQKFLDKVNAVVAAQKHEAKAEPPSDLSIDMRMAHAARVPFTQIRDYDGKSSFAQRLAEAREGNKPTPFAQRLNQALEGHTFVSETYDSQSLAAGYAAAGFKMKGRGSQGFWKDLGISILEAPGVMELLGAIDAPRRLITSTIKETHDFLEGEGFSGEDWYNQAVHMEHQVGAGDAVDTGSIWLDRALGFIGDVALDPLTYVSFGTSAVIRGGSSGLASRAFAAGADDIGTKILRNHYVRLSKGDWARLIEADTALHTSIKKADGTLANPNYVSDIAPGARFNIGRTRVGKKVAQTITAGRRNELTLAIGGQRVSQAIGRVAFAPLGTFHNLRAARLARKVLQGKFASGDRQAARKMLQTGTDDEVKTAFYLMQESNLGRQTEKAFGHEVAQDWKRLSDDLKSQGYSGQDLMRAMDSENFTEIMRKADWERLNEFTKGVVDSANLRAGRDFLQVRANWFPHKRAVDDFTASLAGATNRTGFTKETFERTAKVVENTDFLGTRLVPSSEHPRGLGIQQQAWEIYAKHVVDQGGVGNAARWFSEDIYEAMPSYLEKLSRRVGEQKTLHGLDQRGIARSLWEASDQPLGTLKQRTNAKKALSQINEQQRTVTNADWQKNRTSKNLADSREAVADIEDLIDVARRSTTSTAVELYSRRPQAVAARLTEEAEFPSPLWRQGVGDGTPATPATPANAQLINPLEAIDTAIDAWSASLHHVVTGTTLAKAHLAVAVAENLFGEPAAAMAQLQRRLLALERKMGMDIDAQGVAARLEEMHGFPNRQKELPVRSSNSINMGPIIHNGVADYKSTLDELYKFMTKNDEMMDVLEAEFGLFSRGAPEMWTPHNVELGIGIDPKVLSRANPTGQGRTEVGKKLAAEQLRGRRSELSVREWAGERAPAIREAIDRIDEYQGLAREIDDLEKLERVSNAIVRPAGTKPLPSGRGYVTYIEMPIGSANRAAAIENNRLFFKELDDRTRASLIESEPGELVGNPHAAEDAELIERAKMMTLKDGSKHKRAFISDGVSEGSPQSGQIVRSTDPGVQKGDFVRFHHDDAQGGMAVFSAKTIGRHANDDAPLYRRRKLSVKEANKAVAESHGSSPRFPYSKEHIATMSKTEAAAARRSAKASHGVGRIVGRTGGFPVIRMANGVEIVDVYGIARVMGPRKDNLHSPFRWKTESDVTDAIRRVEAAGAPAGKSTPPNTYKQFAKNNARRKAKGRVELTMEQFVEATDHINAQGAVKWDDASRQLLKTKKNELANAAKGIGYNETSRTIGLDADFTTDAELFTTSFNLENQARAFDEKAPLTTDEFAEIYGPTEARGKGRAQEKDLDIGIQDARINSEVLRRTRKEASATLAPIESFIHIWDETALDLAGQPRLGPPKPRKLIEGVEDQGLGRWLPQDIEDVQYMQGRVRDLSIAEEEAAMILQRREAQAKGLGEQLNVMDLESRHAKGIYDKEEFVNHLELQRVGEDGYLRSVQMGADGSTIESNIFMLHVRGERPGLSPVNGRSWSGAAPASDHLGSSVIHNPVASRAWSETSPASTDYKMVALEMSNPRVVGPIDPKATRNRVPFAKGRMEAEVEELIVPNNAAERGHVAGEGQHEVDVEMFNDALVAGENLFDGTFRSLTPQQIAGDARRYADAQIKSKQRKLSSPRDVGGHGEALYDAAGHSTAAGKGPGEADAIRRGDAQLREEQSELLDEMGPIRDHYATKRSSLKRAKAESRNLSNARKVGARDHRRAHKKIEKYEAEIEEIGQSALDGPNLEFETQKLEAAEGALKKHLEETAAAITARDAVPFVKKYPRQTKPATEARFARIAGTKTEHLRGKVAAVEEAIKTRKLSTGLLKKHQDRLGVLDRAVARQRKIIETLEAKHIGEAAAAKRAKMNETLMKRRAEVRVAKADFDRQQKKMEALSDRIKANRRRLSVDLPEHVRLAQAYGEVARWKRLQRRLLAAGDSPEAKAAAYYAEFGDVFDARRFNGMPVNQDMWVMNRVISDTMGESGFLAPVRRSDAADLYRATLQSRGYDGLSVKQADGSWRITVLDEQQMHSVDGINTIDYASGRTMEFKGNATRREAFDKLRSDRKAALTRIDDSRVAAHKVAEVEFGGQMQFDLLKPVRSQSDGTYHMSRQRDSAMTISDRALRVAARQADGGDAALFEDAVLTHGLVTDAQRKLSEAERWRAVANGIADEHPGGQQSLTLGIEANLGKVDGEDFLWQPQLVDQSPSAVENYQIAIMKGSIAEMEAAETLAVKNWEAELDNLVAMTEGKQGKRVRTLEDRVAHDMETWGKDNPSRRLNPDSGVREVMRGTMDKWVQLEQGLEVPDWVATALRDQFHIGDVGQGLSRTMDVFDRATQFFKGWAMFTTGFHVRNLFGGIFNNFLAGVPAGSYRTFQPGFVAYNEALRGGSRLSVNTGRRGQRATADEALKAGVKALQRNAKNESDAIFLKEAFEHVVNDGHMGGAGLSTEITSRASDQRNLNPFSLGFRPIQKNREIGAQAEHWLRANLAFERIYRARRELKDFPLDGVNPKTGRLWVEEVMEDARHQAVGDVVKFHFDYDDLSDIERRYARRIVPFYTWTRKNLPLQVEMFLTKPGAYTRWTHLDRNMEQGQSEFDYMPEWLQDQINIKMPWGDEDEPIFWSPELPWKDLTRTLEPSQILGMANPILRAPVEVLGNRKAYSIGHDTASGGKINWGHQPLPSYFEEITEVIPGFQQAAVGLGIGSYGDDGSFNMSSRAQYLVEANLPMYGRAARLLAKDNEDQAYKRENMTNAWMSTFTGFGVHTVTEGQQESVRKSRARRAGG